MRAFIGILLPDSLKEKIISLQSRIKNLPVDCKMVERENLHISLSFLGEISDEKAKEICLKLDDISKNYKSFEINIDGLRLIPNEKYVRVIALGIVSSEIEKLTEDVRRFIGGDVKSPHLTLCRVKKISDKNKTISELVKLSLEESFTVDSVHLVKSVLERTGPKYSSVHKSNIS